MMSRNGPPNPGLSLPASLGRYQMEILRWNQQINLVSRQDTLARTAELIGQCRDAWGRLQANVLAQTLPAGEAWYFDLGSGGGLPGFVWHLHLPQVWEQNRTWLFEPREKRAWFLGRLNHISTGRPLTVIPARWGQAQVAAATDAPGAILVSLKALRLTEAEVLEGLSVALAGVNAGFQAEVIIARFFPPRQVLDRALKAELGLTSEVSSVGHLSCVPLGAQVLSPARDTLLPAALVVSRHQISG